MVGYGFIGRVHTHAYLTLPLYYDPAPAQVRLVGVCDTDEKAAAKGVEQAGFEFATTNYHDLLARDDIQIINCCTPNFQHRELLIDALKAGKHIYCDKPLALNLAEAEEICQLAKTVNTVQQMNFECRNSAAMLRAKQMVEEGFLGDVFSFRTVYLHSGYVDASRPMSWRTDFEKSGGGAIVDLGAHIARIYNFLQAIVEGKPGNPSFEDGLAVHRVIDAAYRSAQQGAWVEI